MSQCKPLSRALTVGERQLVSSVFGDEIDVQPVMLHRRRWMPFHLTRYIMAPNGAIYVPPGHAGWRADFSAASLALQGLFIHEMTHIWQHQSGRNLIAERGPLARYRYLPLKPGKPFGRYGLEQQAEIIRHAFLMCRGARPDGCPPAAHYAALVPFPPLRHALLSMVQT